MTITTPTIEAPVATAPVTPLDVTQRRVVISEWIKMRSLRSTVFTLLAAIAIMIGFGLLFGAVFASRWPHMEAAERARFNATDVTLRGFFLGQLAIGVLGVLMITGEYSTGMIRATISAVPRRLPVLWAKLGVFAAVTAVVMIAASFVAFLGGQALLSSRHLQTTLSAPGVPRAIIGVGLYLTVVGLLGMSLGFIIRNTAGAISALFGILLILPVLGEVLPAGDGRNIVPYLPSNAGQALFTLSPDPNTLAPWTGFAVLMGYAVVAVSVAAALLKRRDA